MYIRIAYPVAPSVAALVGFPVGCCTGYLLGPSVIRLAVGGSITSALLTVGASLLVGSVATVWFSDRRLSAFLAGSFFTLGLIFFALTRMITMVSPTGLAAIIVASIILGAIGGGVLLVIDAFFRTTWIEFVAQDGTRCPRCAYPMHTSGPSKRCPECGTFVSEVLRRQEQRARVIGSLNRRGPCVLAVMVVVVLGPALTLSIWSSSQYKRFAQYVSESGGQDVYTSRVGTGQDVWRGPGTALPVPGDPSKLLLVTFAPHGLGTHPRMQLRLGWRFQPTPASPATHIDGLPPILCNLSADQAESLMQHGVPESLLDAMLDASQSARWPARN